MKTIKDLTPNPRNPRTISDSKLNMLKKSMKEFGSLDGMIFNKRSNRLVGGHQRRTVDPDAPITITKVYDTPTEVGTVEEGFILINGESYPYRGVDWDDKKEMAANIAANKGAGQWDFPELSNWFIELDDGAFDLNLTMFDAEEREKIVVPVEKVAPGCDEDEIPELQEEPKTRLGDIYQLGNHRLMCGDSTSIDAVEKLMNGDTVHLIFTDPPYNVAFNGRSGKHDVIKNDNLSDEDFKGFIKEVCQTLATLNAPIQYVWCNWKFYGLLQENIPYKACIVWAKNVFGMGIGYRHQHEFCLFNGKIDEHIKNESDLWNCKKDHNYVHPTQKPVELAERAFGNHVKAMHVLDLFGGSGSTLIACEKTDRQCFMSELDPHYVDVIVQRWMKFTGKMAYLIEDSSGPLKEPVPYAEMDSFRGEITEPDNNTIDNARVSL